MVSALTRSLLPPHKQSDYLRPDVVQDVQVRLNRLAGHLHAIAGMLAEGRDCADVLTQLIAVRAALTQVNVHLMEAHMEICLDTIHGPEDQWQALERLGTALEAALSEERRG